MSADIASYYHTIGLDQTTTDLRLIPFFQNPLDPLDETIIIYRKPVLAFGDSFSAFISSVAQKKIVARLCSFMASLIVVRNM